MPEVVVYILEGRTLEQKRGLVKDITEAVVKNAGTTADHVTGVSRRNGENVEGQRRRAVQRDGSALARLNADFGCARGCRAAGGLRFFAAVKITVGALHNRLAAVR